MAFLETPRFPERISLRSVGGPGFQTDVVTVTSGQEKRNANWTLSRHRFEVSQAVKTEEDFRAVRAFFLAVRGKLDGFRFKDFTDYQVADSEGAVNGITSTTFQLVKKYTAGATTTRREIRKPIASGFALRDSGVLLTLTTDYTLDATTGIVTTTISRTAGNLSWAGQFDVPCRFDVDELRAQVVGKNSTGLLMAWESIPIIEIRPE